MSPKQMVPFMPAQRTDSTGIVAAMAEKFSTTYQKPWVSLTYDGFLETNNAARISNFAELLKFCRQEASTV